MTVLASLSTPVSYGLIDLDSIFLTMKLLVVAKITAKNRRLKTRQYKTQGSHGILCIYIIIILLGL